MNCEKKYFFITIHFSPNYEGFFKQISSNIYLDLATGELLRKRMLFDFGWGQESGYELLPERSFDELICLVEHQLEPRKKTILQKHTEQEKHDMDIHKSNLFGAVSVIMQDHLEEFIDFLSLKIKTDYFSDFGIRNNFKWFSFSNQKMHELGLIPGSILGHSYEYYFIQHEKWREISTQVIRQIYG